MKIGRLARASRCIRLGAQGAMLACAALAPAAGASEPASAPPPQTAANIESDWSLRLPPQGKVAFRGVVNFDDAGMGASTMMYPAPNAGGFLIGILAHAAIVEGSKQREKERLQEAADSGLQSIQPVLSTYTYRDLGALSMADETGLRPRKLLEAADVPASAWHVESVPVFSMTSDHSAMLVDNAVAVYARGDFSKPVYRNTVRVVSTPQTKLADDFWIAGEGANLKTRSAALLKQSLKLALADVAGQLREEGKPQRTVRYREGEAERMERGHLLAERCGRAVVKNLRGWLMSVPLSRPAPPAAPDDPHCAAEAAF